jgi:predicted DNA-binding antitoxin AbrB/MazE fold protein
VTIRAKYEDGVFKPLEDIAIKAGTVVEVFVPSSPNAATRKPQSVRDFAFFGLWKDRSDIAASVEDINKLRGDLR